MSTPSRLAPPSAFHREYGLSITGLSPETASRLEQALVVHRRQGYATTLVLLDPTGAPLVEAGEGGSADLDTLCVLAAASFCALKELGRALGDRVFGGICHQGQTQTIYVAPLAHDFMLLGLYPPERRPREIRQALARLVPALDAILPEGSADRETSYLT